MNATKEQWKYGVGERVWAGKYLNSQNTLHWHSECELVYVERGELEVTADGARYTITAGDGMFFDSGCLHRINAVDPSSLLATIIFDAGLISAFALSPVPPVFPGERIFRAYGKLLDELKTKPPLYEHSTAVAVQTLMIDIFRAQSTEPKKSSVTDEKLKALFAAIHENCEWYSESDAARFMSMNTSYFSRFFSAKTGMRFSLYLNCVRVEKAVELLNSDLVMTEIAARCGFGTIRSFNGTFKKLTGYSPSALPRGYVFHAAAAEADMRVADPTLLGCTLVESSNA